MTRVKDKYYKQSRYTYAGRQKCVIASDTSSYKTELDVTDNESEALEIIGACLFAYTMKDWSDCQAGKTNCERKAQLRKHLGDRYAYAIVSRNNDQLALQKRNIEQDIKLKKLENQAFDKRHKQAQKWLEKHPDITDDSGNKPTKDQYNPLTYKEWGRYRHNESVLARYENKDYVGVTFGGKSAQKIAVRAVQKDPNDPDAWEKHRAWKLSRYQIKAIGDSTHACGNSVVRVDENGVVRILVPEEVRKTIAEKLGKTLVSDKYLVLEKPAVFAYGWDVLLDNITQNKSVTSSITHTNGSWRITSTANSSSVKNQVASQASLDGGSVSSDNNKQSFASGKKNPAVIAKNEVKKLKKENERNTVSAGLDRSLLSKQKDSSRFMGIDVNDGHIDVAICDVHGNLCGKPMTFEFRQEGTSVQRKSSILHVLDRLHHIVRKRHISGVFIEDLKGFIDAKSKPLNDGGRAFRRSVHRIPTGELKEWIVRKLTFEDCHVELVSAAYTSKCAEVFWSDLFLSNHQAAALMIARRGLGLGLFRRRVTSPDRSCVTDGDCSSSGLDSEKPMTNGEQTHVGSDHSEELASASNDICGASALKGLLLRTPRRSHCLTIPVDSLVPR